MSEIAVLKGMVSLFIKTGVIQGLRRKSDCFLFLKSSDIGHAQNPFYDDCCEGLQSKLVDDSRNKLIIKPTSLKEIFTEKLVCPKMKLVHMCALF